MTLKKVDSLRVLHLFPEMRQELLEILRGLDDDAWAAPTSCLGWSVKDVAAHILADDCGYLSRHRDGEGITFETGSWDELIGLINAQNEAWVAVHKRLSRGLLLSLLEFTGQQLFDYLQSVDQSTTTDPISWAGSGPAPMWLQVARELTEYWMHHQHIAEAVGRDSLKTRRYLLPVLSTFVHALPRTYADIHLSERTLVKVLFHGEAESQWHLVGEHGTWKLFADSDLAPAAEVHIPDDIAWRLFTRGIDPVQARAASELRGDRVLAAKFFETIAILA
jgi:uncharacterized protein (TIGR03083 family)